jgi:hypothetical protein
MINRQKGIIIGVGVALGVACLGISVLFFNALSTSRDAAMKRDLAYGELKSLYETKVFPKDDNINRIKTDQKELEAWEANVSNFLAKASIKADDLTPVRFKQALQKTVHQLASKKSKSLNKTYVAEDFKFGFDRYLGDSDSLPQLADVPKLAQQLHLIQAVVGELYDAKITKLTLVEREVFEADATERKGRSGAGGGTKPARPTAAASRPTQKPVAATGPVVSDGVNPVLSPLLTRQKLTFGFQAKPSALMGVLNRLAAMDSFAVVTSVEFTKDVDSVMLVEDRKRALLKASEDGKKVGDGGATAVTDITRDRLVTDPEREPPLDVIMSVDVYLFKGV